jgi:hypothetical protein
VDGRKPGKLRLIVISSVVAVCCGCSSKFADVNGKVTLAGKPISKGTISFTPADGRGPTAAEKITDGQFLIRLLPGRYKVEILGYRKVGERHANQSDPTSPMMDMTEQIVPERYNAATTLTQELKAGTQDITFPLEQK